MATITVNRSIGTGVLGTVTIPDAAKGLRVTLSSWSQAGRSLALACDISLNGGTTWLPMCTTGPRAGNFGVLPKPPGFFLSGLPALCTVCGQPYIPGVTGYDRALTHSTVTLAPGWTLAMIGQRVPYPVVSTADFLLRILVDQNGADFDNQAVVRTFHTPTQNVSTPRQIRFTGTASGGTVVSTLTWTAT